jgi:transcriptional regulator with XRE-family HTH domain
MYDLSKSLGRRIHALRANRGFSQEEMAEKAGMSVKHFGKIERGAVNVSLQCLNAIAAALGMSVRDVLEVEHERDRDELLAELHDGLAGLSLRDVRVVHRLVRFLTGR